MRTKAVSSGVGFLKRISSYVIDSLEVFFYRWGCFVATHPFVIIFTCLTVTGLCTLGFLNFSSESRAEKLWIPTDSPYISNKAWLDRNFPKNTRTQLALFVSEENILTPIAMMELLKLHQKVVAINVQNKTWADLCYKLPIADIFLSRRRREAAIEAAVEAAVSTLVPAVPGAAVPPVPAGDPAQSGPPVKTNKNAQANKADPLRVAPVAVIGGSDDAKLVPIVAGDAQAASASTGRDKANASLVLDNQLLWGDYSDGSSSEVEEDQNNSSSNSSKSVASVWGEDYSVGGDSETDYNGDYDHDQTDEDAKAGKAPSGDKPEGESADDLAKSLPPEIYCDLVTTLSDKCLENSLLEMWEFNPKVIEALTQQDIIDAVNLMEESPYYGYKFNFSTYLGAVERNASGHIVSAKATLSVWTTAFDPSQLLVEEGGTGIELELADPLSLAWEKEVVTAMLDSSNEQETGVRILANAARSFNDISSAALFFDGIKMVSGYLIMFAYTFLMLGRINLIEHRFYLTAAGIISVAMGLLIAYGLSSAFGLPYTPIHAILPFLCIGIGIDDMFVIVQCWYNLSEDDRQKSLKEQIGLTMRHAGVAISVTSFTDVCAFAVGAVTILPGLQAFCVSCAIGIGCIYLMQASWFVAWLALDQRRIGKRRDGCLPCLTHSKPAVDDCSQRQVGRRVMQCVTSPLRNPFCQAFVIVTTLCLFGVGVWGTVIIKQEFDPVLLLPGDSYLRQWIDTNEVLFPQKGWNAEVYTGPISSHSPDQDLRKLDRLVHRLEEMVDNKIILSSVDAWWSQFKHYLRATKNVTAWDGAVADGNFAALLSDFLFSRVGSKYQKNFHFGDQLVCNRPAPNITATQFAITYLAFSGSDEHIPGRRAVEDLIKGMHFSSHAFSFSKVYAAWETDEVIGFELWRNLGTAMVAVFVIILIFLADVKISLIVLVCVIFTLIDLVGMLHFWNITIDTISCVNIVLAIGLCVDYAAHVAHAFIVEEGSRTDRAINGLITMGPAIVNGGVTTFLALVLLGFSKSHAFVIFFKVFLLTVVFGLFHGLVFLPVMLILMGPGPRSKSEDATSASASASSPSSGRVTATTASTDSASCEASSLGEAVEAGDCYQKYQAHDNAAFGHDDDTCKQPDGKAKAKGLQTLFGAFQSAPWSQRTPRRPATPPTPPTPGTPVSSSSMSVRSSSASSEDADSAGPAAPSPSTSPPPSPTEMH